MKIEKILLVTSIVFAVAAIGLTVKKKIDYKKQTAK